MQPKLPQAIYVAAQGLLSTPGDATTSGWPNTNGGDIAFLNAMLTWLESNLCVDTTRIMSTGMSYGGIMSDTIGCQMPDVFRAVAVMSGALFGRAAPAARATTSPPGSPTATADTTVDISGDETARDQFLADNHCGTTSTAVDPVPLHVLRRLRQRLPGRLVPRRRVKATPSPASPPAPSPPSSASSSGGGRRATRLK